MIGRSDPNAGVGRTERYPVDRSPVELPAHPVARWSTRRYVVIAAFCVALIGVLGLYANNERVLSPYDEQQHLDYALKAGGLHLPADNERLGQDAMRETACRGIDTAGLVVPECDSDAFDPATFPDLGYNTAAGALPGYYLPTGVLGGFIEAATPVSSPLLAIRIVSAIWFALGVAVFFALGRDFGSTVLQSAIVATLLAATPVIFTAATKATPDSMLFLTGGLVLLAATRWQQGRIGLWAPAAAATLAMLVDRSNLLALVVAGAFILTPLFTNQSWQRPRWPDRGQPIDATSAGTLLLAVFGMAILLTEFAVPALRELLTGSSGALTVDLPRFLNQARPPFSRSVFLGSFPNMVSPVAQGYLPDLAEDETYRSLTALVNWLVIGGAFGTAAWASARSVQRRLGAATATVMVLAGPMLSTGQWLLGGLYFTLPARYGLPMMPALGVTLALSIRGRALTVVIGGIATIQFALFAYRVVSQA